jgi:short-chain Z-isoprenyl diphosphate synthase
MGFSLWPLYWGYEERLLKQIRQVGVVPKHLGLILDGNRRFAREKGLVVAQGHKMGHDKTLEVLDWCLQLQIPTVTLWGFSTENFKRDPEEVRALMELFVRAAQDLLKDERVHEHKVRVRVIGDLSRFPEDVLAAFHDLEEQTRDYDGMLLQIALGYGGRAEIVEAVRGLVRECPAEGADREGIAACITEEAIGQHLYTAGVPDPDFIIRTSGEIRLSGFLLWQAAYSEYYFVDVFWPSFRRVDFLRAIRAYQGRQRRFGK